MHDWRFNLWALILIVCAAYFLALTGRGLFCWWREWAALRWYESAAYMKFHMAGDGPLERGRKPWYVRSFERGYALRGADGH